MEDFNNEDVIGIEQEEAKPLSLTARINLHLRNNYKLWSYIVLGVILSIVVIYFAVDYFKKARANDIEEAGTAIARLIPAINQKDPESIRIALYGDKSIVIRNKPLIGLIEIAKKYDNLPQGKLAALYAGNLFMVDKKFSEAEKYFKQATDADSKLVLQGAYAGLGSIAEYQNNFQKAIENYEKAVKNYADYGSKNRYEYYMGLCYEKLNKKEEAIKIYNGIISENKSYEFVGRAKMGLVRLGTVIE